MSNAKVVMGQAANTLVKPLEVEDVFSTYLYTGTGSALTITNGIDLSGEGGLVWIKNRDYTYAHMLHDTEATGVENVLRLPNTGGISYDVDTLTSFNSDGFTIGADSEVNENGTGWTGHTSWTFRKAPKFFDVVTYAGTGSVQNISHNLGTTVGSILIKKTSNSSSWAVYHRGSNLGSSPEGYYLALDTTAAQNGSGSVWNNTAPTDTQFTVGTNTVANTSGETYVAYLFAHNDGDGEFGPDGDADIIKCGSYTGNGSNDGPEIDLGFEPQWLMVKAASTTGDWKLYDSMRGLNASGASDYFLEPNTSDIEDLGGYYAVSPTGFKLTDNTSFHNSSGDTYIYIAIRRGTKVPESATEVFAVDTADGSTLPQYKSGFVTDMALRVNNITSSHNNFVYSRLTQGKYLTTESTNVEGSSTAFPFDYMNGYCSLTSTDSNNYSWMWKRAPNFFDMVAYTGDGTAGRTVSHNLGVAPEMMWVKKRSGVDPWCVYHSGLDVDGDGRPETDFIRFSTSAASDSNTLWNDTAPTSTVFTLGTNQDCNHSGETFIAYLFASLPGISKVGSYTGSNDVGPQTIDCGFTSGARFVLIKSYTGIGEWFLFDSLRGITVGSTDPLLQLQSTDPEYTEAAWSGVDMIQPHPSGFTLATSGEVNNYTRSYIFYAIA